MDVSTKPQVSVGVEMNSALRVGGEASVADAARSECIERFTGQDSSFQETEKEALPGNGATMAAKDDTSNYDQGTAHSPPGTSAALRASSGSAGDEVSEAKSLSGRSPSGSPVGEGTAAENTQAPASMELSQSVKTEISEMLREIHNGVFEEHKKHPSKKWTKRSLRSCYVDDKQMAPCCDDLLDAFGIDPTVVPEMSVEEVVQLLQRLFGSRRRYICRVFEREQIDGGGLMLLNLNGFLDMLKLPVGPAVTLDNICKKVRQVRRIPPPPD